MSDLDMKQSDHPAHNMPDSKYQGDPPDDGTKGPTKSDVAAESDWTVRMEGANRNKGDY